MRLEAPSLALPGLRHGFFGRAGGVSRGAFASLHAGLRAPAERAGALENRRRIAHVLGADPARLAVARQVHGGVCLGVTEAWPPLDAPEADALATNVPGLALGVTTADCVPVLFADPTARVIAAAHAGWRGALGGVVEAALLAMRGLGARPDAIRVAIGPAIRQASYEVGPDLRQTFLEGDPDAAPFFVAGEGDRFRLDLPGYVALRLRRAGVGRIEDVGEDTLAQPGRFFSYRHATREGAGAHGVQLSAILLTA
ncbi:MAG: peptidoglycan editing factor PgeF [Geminicoccaceae bacterium]|nr:peptidoglycan editing factor PgeF [Geminicoccaceae bacterium]